MEPGLVIESRFRVRVARPYRRNLNVRQGAAHMSPLISRRPRRGRDHPARGRTSGTSKTRTSIPLRVGTSNHLVRLLDRLRTGGIAVRSPDTDRLARSDLPLHLRSDLTEPRRRSTPGGRRSAVDHGSGGGGTEHRAARPLEADTETDQGRAFPHTLPIGSQRRPRGAITLGLMPHEIFHATRTGPETTGQATPPMTTSHSNAASHEESRSPTSTRS